MCNAISFRLFHFFPLHPNFSHLCWIIFSSYVGWAYNWQAFDNYDRIVVKASASKDGIYEDNMIYMF